MLFVLLTFGPRFCNVPWAALPIGVMILGALHLNFANPPPYGPRYQLTDRLGVETSFPYVGGKAKLFCDDGKGGLQKLLNVSEGPLNPVEMKTGEIELKPSEVDMKYGCPGNLGAFTIGQLHCDPFSLIPNVTCSDRQWCLIMKDGQAICKDMHYEQCFLGDDKKKNYKKSLPKYKAACSNETDSEKILEFGSCDAKSQGTKLYGISVNKGNCYNMQHLILNNFAVHHDETLLIPVTEKKWNLQFKGVQKSDIKCTMTDSSNVSYADIATFQTKSIVQPKFHDMILPKKLKLSCFLDTTSLIEAFVIVYDPNLSKYNVEISKKLKPQHLELSCSCNLPEGFVCGLTWEEPEIIKGLQDMPLPPGAKKLQRKMHARPIVYTCYMRVLAFDYPYTFKLKPVPLSVHKEANITVDTSDFDAGNDGTNGNEDNNGAGKGKTGNGKDGKGKNNNNENKSNEDSKSNLLYAYVVGLLPGSFIIAGLTLTLCIYIKSRRLRNFHDDIEMMHEDLQNKKRARDLQ